jgi:hypothetical protein
LLLGRHSGAEPGSPASFAGWGGSQNLCIRLLNQLTFGNMDAQSPRLHIFFCYNLVDVLWEVGNLLTITNHLG